MALYRLEAKIIGRTPKNKDGKPIPGKRVSIVAKAAYRSGERLRDEQQDKAFNYRSRSQEVLHCEILTPGSAPSWMEADRQRLWNEIERCEKRKDSQLAREFIIALPVELSKEQQVEAIRTWCEAEIVSKGYVADFALHRSKNGKNPHAHILQTLRPVEGESFGKKPDTSGQWNGRGSVGKGIKNELATWRESWEAHCNAALEDAGSNARVDHRSLKAQGIDRAPQPKVGVNATAMERKGIATERSKLLRWAKMDNLVSFARQSILTRGEVAQIGTGATWWERAQVAIRTGVQYGAEQMVELWRDESSGGRLNANREKTEPSNTYWQDFVAARPQNIRNEPEIEPGA